MEQKLLDQEALERVIARLDQAAAGIPAPPEGLAASALARARRERAARSAGKRLWWPALGRPAFAGALVAVAFTLLLIWQAAGPVPRPGAERPEKQAKRAEIQAPEASRAVDLAAVKAPTDEALPAGEKAGPQVMLAQTEEPWAVVFTGAAQEAQEVADRLADGGVTARRRTVAAGVEVTVSAQELDRAKEILATELTKQN